ncbi:hypothetical protein ACN26Y_18745 [Micromonospora sp. WMMD558]|uniref:hypothetical protein n=1 Tax=unclassified Micromonospora TaxID=2617518 RepID=UPI0012B4F834|nr:hypothetical protein [Micromonospora sp. WMMC415]QGN48132.1 hypothetical protein GKC29_15645 [Micromonospora sp. WMMC415]
MTDRIERSDAAPPAVDVAVAAARVAVARLAPEELAVFDELAAEWRRRPERVRWSAPGRSVGFGVETVLVTEVALQAAGQAVAEVLVLGGALLGRRWWRRRQSEPPVVVGVVEPGEGGKPPRLALTAEQARRLRYACRQHATALGLDAARARVLADAVVGALHLDSEAT